MKTDIYTKIVLTVIAACLLGLVFRDVPTITTAHAEGTAGTADTPTYVIIEGTQKPLPVTNPKLNDGYNTPMPLLVRGKLE